MSNPAPAFQSDRAIRRALARDAYRQGRIRIASTTIAGFDCLAATRQGLFAVAQDRVQPVVYGLFFGTARYDGHIYIFEACDAPANRTAMGRILRFAERDGHLADPTILITGLDNQCHQIAVIDGLLHIVDTANQRLLRHRLDGSAVDAIAPFPDDPDYRHINSIVAIGDHIALLLHNGAGGEVRPSELAIFDRQWRQLDRRPIAGHGCHDIWSDARDTVWHCGSMAGELVSEKGERIVLSNAMTRGVAQLGDRLLVGTSLFGSRGDRDQLGGSIIWCDEAYRPIAELSLPGAPTTLLALPPSGRSMKI